MKIAKKKFFLKKLNLQEFIFFQNENLKMN
jgi:hypothetical protein